MRNYNGGLPNVGRTFTGPAALPAPPAGVAGAFT